MSNFREIVKFMPFFEVQKFLNSWNSGMLYIILKHAIWGIRIYGLFKYLENMSNNRFPEIQ